jgi:hypothetical protein
MALKLDLDHTDIGVPLAGAYARITNWTGNKDQTQFVVEFYASEEARQDGARSVRTEAYYVSTPDAPSLSEMYSWLKMQPGFEVAEDV